MIFDNITGATNIAIVGGVPYSYIKNCVIAKSDPVDNGTSVYNSMIWDTTLYETPYSSIAISGDDHVDYFVDALNKNFRTIQEYETGNVEQMQQPVLYDMDGNHPCIIL